LKQGGKVIKAIMNI